MYAQIINFPTKEYFSNSRDALKKAYRGISQPLPCLIFAWCQIFWDNKRQEHNSFCLIVTAFGIVGSLIMTFMLVFWLFKNIMTSAYDSAFTYLGVRNYSWDARQKELGDAQSLIQDNFEFFPEIPLQAWADFLIEFSEATAENFLSFTFFAENSISMSCRLCACQRWKDYSSVHYWIIQLKWISRDFSRCSLLMNVAGCETTRKEQIIPIFHRFSCASR